MKKFTLLLLLVTLLSGISSTVRADELLVHDGTTTNSYIPMYGHYVDTKGELSEFIIPSDDLASISGRTITALKFYSSSTSISWGAAQFKVYVKEVTDGALDSGFSTDTDATTVYEGSLSIASSGEMAIEFSNEYQYGGGNLLVGIYVSTSGSYQKASFYGEGGFDIVYSRYRSSASGNGSAQYFIPKTSITYVANGPSLGVYIGENKLKSGSTMESMDENPNGSGENTPKITVKNTGTAAMSNISISWTGTNAESFSVGTYNTSLEVGAEQEVALTMPEAAGEYNATLTVTADDIDAFTFGVHLFVLDKNKLHIDFDHNDLPEGWTNSGWTINNGYARVNSYGTTATITSGKVEASDNEMMVFKFRRNSSSTSSWYGSSFKVYASEDGTNWGDALINQSASGTELNDWTIMSCVVPTTTKYLKIEGQYVDIQEIYGCSLPQEAIMKVEPTEVNFGFIAGPQTNTVTIRNAGTIDLTNLTAAIDEASDEGFSIQLDNSTVAPGQNTTLRITLGNEHKGNREAIINITADGQEPVQLSAQGYVADNTKILIAFDGNNPLPDSWTNNGWNISDGTATGVYVSGNTSHNSEMVSPKIKVEQGESMVIEAKGTSSYAELYVYTSTDGETWTKQGEYNTALRAETNVYKVNTLTVPAGTYFFKFEGYAVVMNHINGFNYDDNAPIMTVTDADNNQVSGTVDLAFGKVTGAVSKTYTVSNTGTGTLNVLLESSNTSDFTVDKEDMALATGESETFTVTMVAEPFGEKNATITVVSDDATLTVNATATSMDPNVWFEDFENGSLPAGWVANGWTVGTFSSYENTTPMALAPNSSTAGTLITPRLYAKAGEVLAWDAYFQWTDEAMTVEYSSDEQQTWNAIYSYKPEDDGISSKYYHKAMQFTAPADGSYYLRFTSTYQNGVDNFYGFALDMPEHSMSITSFSIPTTGLKTEMESQATVTVKENLGVDEENVMAKLYINEEYVANSDAVSFNANEQKTLTIPFIPTTAGDVEMYIEVVYAGGTLKSEAVIRTVAEINKLELTETEEKEITTGYSAVYDVVTLTRSFVAGWNTFVAPQAVAVYDISENAKVYQFDDYADSELKFKTVTDRTLTPATPYIIYLTEAKEVTFTWNNPVIYSSYVGADNIKVAKNGVTFQGTYAPIAAPNMQGMYGVTPAGKIQKGGAGASMKGFRAYFDMGANSAPEFSLLFDGVATGITKATIFDNYEGDIYDLQGRKVNKAQMHKGIYVVNGRKVVVK